MRCLAGFSRIRYAFLIEAVYLVIGLKVVVKQNVRSTVAVGRDSVRNQIAESELGAGSMSLGRPRPHPSESVDVALALLELVSIVPLD